jgi:hypothetical protein
MRDNWDAMSDKRAMLRHFLAAIAYRTQKALRAICSSTTSRESESRVLMRADQAHGCSDQIRVVPCLLTIWQ